MADPTGIRKRFELLKTKLDEMTRRCVAAAEAAAIGYGGISVVSRATGMSRRAIRVGSRELRER